MQAVAARWFSTADAGRATTEIGLGLLTAQQRPDDDGLTTAVYDDLPTLAETADEAGLESVWTSEHHYHITDDGSLLRTTPVLSALATRTDEIRVGSAVALAPLYDPVRLAEDAATVAALSDDRLTLGLSIGSWDREFRNFGVPRDGRTERTEDALSLLRNAWEPGQLECESDFHAIEPETEVTPTPDEIPPIVLGGLAKPAVRRAARLADGWCANEMLSLEDIRVRMGDIERIRDEEGDRRRVYDLHHPLRLRRRLAGRRLGTASRRLLLPAAQVRRADGRRADRRTPSGAQAGGEGGRDIRHAGTGSGRTRGVS